MSLDRINSGRELIRLSLRLFGRDHAIKLWQKIELPGYDLIPRAQLNIDDQSGADAMAVLRHMLGRPIPGMDLTIGEALNQLDGDDELRRKLLRMGIRAEDGILVVSLADQVWGAWFAHTPWAKGWRRVIRCLPGIGRRRSVYFTDNFTSWSIDVPMSRVDDILGES
jgi:hypothetical protein